MPGLVLAMTAVQMQTFRALLILRSRRSLRLEG